MGRYSKIYILLLSMSLVLCSCFNLKQPRNKIEFYTLEYDLPRISGLEPIPLVIRIARFSVFSTYNTNRIIYQDDSFKRDSYAYHKWRINPGDLVTYFLSRDMQRSGLFKAILPHDSRFPSSYMLEGSVDDFFEWDIEKNWKAILTITVTLMSENEPDISKKILFQKTYRAKKACNQKNPQALAEAMSQAMGEISGKIIRDIHGYLKKMPS